MRMARLFVTGLPGRWHYWLGNFDVASAGAARPDRLRRSQLRHLQ